MKPFLKRLLVVVVVAVALAGILLLITSLSPALSENAKAHAARLNMGRVGIVVAGLLAPILYLFKRIGEWFSRVFLGGVGPGKTERGLAERTKVIEAELTRLRQEVKDIGDVRQRALDAEHTRLAAIEAKLSSLQRSLGGVDQEIERLQTAPPPARIQTDEELIETWQQADGFIELPVAQPPLTRIRE